LSFFLKPAAFGLRIAAQKVFGWQTNVGENAEVRFERACGAL